jgi:hypothetical protein
MNDHPLPTLRDRLLSLHKQLMVAERARYESEGHVVRSPLHFLQLLTEHERFAWLRQLSQLVVKMDEAMETKPAMSRDRADDLAREALDLLTLGDGSGSFSERYASLRKGNADLGEAHAQLMNLFATLPE